MRALLLAAGIGSRLRPFTEMLPKCLVPVRGRPLLDYWLNMLAGAGVDDILINTHHHGDMVRRFVTASPCANRVEITFEPSLLGTAGTVLRNRAFLERGEFLLAHADNLTVFDPAAFFRAHAARPAGTDITMMTFTAEDPRACGIVQLDRGGVVQGFQEKVQAPLGDIANAAVYMVEPSLIAYLESLRKEVIDFSTEVLPRYVGRTFTFHNAEYHRDIGTLESLRAAQTDFPLPAEEWSNTYWDSLMESKRGELRKRIEKLLAPRHDRTAAPQRKI